MSGIISRLFNQIMPPKKKAAPGPTAPAKKTPDAIETVDLKAWRSPTLNRTILIAYLPDADPTNPNNLVTVRVRNNEKFLPGMTLHARQVRDKVYDLVGPLPRWRGRW